MHPSKEPGAGDGEGESGGPESAAAAEEDGGLHGSTSPRDFMYKLPSFDKEPATAEQVVHFLVGNGYLLSALELLVEAGEDGDAAIVDLLGPFFSNPRHFPPEEIGKCSGDEGYRLAAELAERDRLLSEAQEKAALAEYELRLAREDIRVLEARLAVGGEAPAAASARGGEDSPPDGSPGRGPTGSRPLPATDPEIQKLNSIVHGYLSSRSYMLTLMTLEDEAGAALPESSFAAPPLSECYQAFKDVEGMSSEWSVLEAERDRLRDSLERADADAAELRALIEQYEMENKCLRGDIDVLNRQLQGLQGPDEDGNPGGGTAAADEDTPLQSKVSYVRRGGTIHAVEALRVIADALPRIVPSVLINARADLLPVFIVMIQEHPDTPARRSLARALFNLVKKPNSAQRQMILRGCKDLASRIGTARTMDELLPHCWEQLTDKYPERRMLVAETCGHLAPFVSAETRQSLLLGVLGQLADDPKPAVRAVVASSLPLLISSLEDFEKYAQIEDLCFQLCTDVAEEVQESAVSSLLPAILDWIRPTERLSASLLPHLLERMQGVLKTAPAVGGLPGALELRVVGPVQHDQLQVLLQIWSTIVPEFRQAALSECPHWIRSVMAEEAAPSHRAVEVARAGSEPPMSGGAIGPQLSCRSQSCAAETGSPAHYNPFEDGANTTNPFLEPTFDPRATTPRRTETGTNPFEGSDGTGGTGSEADSGGSNPFEGATAIPPERPSSSGGGSGGGTDAPEVRPLSEAASLSRSPSPPPRKDQPTYTDDQALAAFAAWATAGSGGEEWGLLRWLVDFALPKLIAVFRTVYPSESVEMLRHSFCHCMQSICEAMGETFASEVLVPIFTSAVASPAGGSAPERVSEAAAALAPSGRHGEQIARKTLLPVLLGGVLRYAGDNALNEYLVLMFDEGREQGGSWGLAHREDLLPVFLFATNIVDLQLELLGVVHQLVASPSAALRQAAALIGTALACNLETHAVERRLLPALTRLAEDKHRQVRLAVVDAVAEVSRRHCQESPTLLSKLCMILDSLIMDGGPQHEVQMAAVSSLSEGVPFASERQLEYLLQKSLWLMASVAQRQTCGKPPSQVAETAAVVFDCLRAVDRCESQLTQQHNLQLHMVSALTSLQREAELLDASRRELLSAMLRDHAAATPAMQTPGEAPVLQTFAAPKPQMAAGAGSAVADSPRSAS
mmetsp:Transcript_30742/g.73195  ORF Transcript_30742/g.73195 Transcript_30742/m.73195 type:complete len:1194 (-) Transcript_30742:80-3661(-)